MRTRGFEKISYDEFKNYFGANMDLYEAYKLPKRNTRTSAGYDFYAVEEITLLPGEIKKIPTGIKCYMQEDETLLTVVRSSMGFKYNVRMCNQVGVFESDYHNNTSNEGNMFFALQNEGKETVTIKAGEHFVQGIFMKFLTIDNEEEIKNIRTGGIGSTT